MYQGKRSDFETLLKNEKYVTIHLKNLHCPVTEIYKAKNNIFSHIIWGIPHFQENKNSTEWGMRTTLIGKKLVSNKIWPLLTEELRSASSLQVFKNKFKKWKLTNCPCTPSCLIVARWGCWIKCTRAGYC